MNFWTLQLSGWCGWWIFFLRSPIAHCSFTKGWILDSILTWLSYIYLRGVQVVPAVFLISLSTFFFLTSDISGSCWHLIFKWKWLSWMKAVPLQPSRHRWHLSLVFRESALFFVWMKPSWTKWNEPLRLPSILLKFGIATWKTHEKFTQKPIFQG